MLYIGFACYVAAIIALLALYFRSDYASIVLGAVAPSIALLAMIGFQICARTRCSCFTFCVVLGGLFAVAYLTGVLSTVARLLDAV